MRILQIIIKRSISGSRNSHIAGGSCVFLGVGLSAQRRSS